MCQIQNNSRKKLFIIKETLDNDRNLENYKKQKLEWINSHHRGDMHSSQKLIVSSILLQGWRVANKWNAAYLKLMESRGKLSTL